MHRPRVHPVGVVVMDCTHSRERRIVEVYQCEVCGRVEPRRVRESVTKVPVVLVRQGLLTADILIDTLGFAGHDAEYLRSIEVCPHPADRVRRGTCQHSGNGRLTCQDCGRVWSRADN